MSPDPIPVARTRDQLVKACEIGNSELIDHAAKALVAILGYQLCPAGGIGAQARRESVALDHEWLMLNGGGLS